MAALLLAGSQVVSRERLIDVVWGEDRRGPSATRCRCTCLGCVRNWLPVWTDATSSLPRRRAIAYMSIVTSSMWRASSIW